MTNELNIFGEPIDTYEIDAPQIIETERNADLAFVSSAIAGALTYGNIDAAKALSLFGIELANCTGDKTEIYRKINVAAGYAGTSSMLE